MALVTAGAEAAIVHIVLAVARYTSASQRRRILARWCHLFVTALTGHFDVRTLKAVLGLGVVIERPRRPGPGVVTRFAARSEHLLVLVILFMACVAITGGVFVTHCFVALLAFHNNVLTG